LTAIFTDRPQAEARSRRLPRPDAPRKIRYATGLALAAHLLCWATRNNGER
jgi:hypothetical protein